MRDFEPLRVWPPANARPFTWCPLCGGDADASDHERLCAEKMAEWEPQGIEAIIGEDDD